MNREEGREGTEWNCVCYGGGPAFGAWAGRQTRWETRATATLDPLPAPGLASPVIARRKVEKGAVTRFIKNEHI